MKQLLVMDAQNYANTTSVFEKTGVRAIIEQDGKLAVQHGRNGDYKLPGGGIEGSETPLETLLREVQEETGLLVLPETIEEIGRVEELRQDIFDPTVKFICHTLYYRCRVSGETVALALTQSELDKGYEPAWATIADICHANEAVLTEAWALRDTAVLKLLQAGTAVLPKVHIR